MMNLHRRAAINLMNRDGLAVLPPPCLLALRFSCNRATAVDGHYARERLCLRALQVLPRLLERAYVRFNVESRTWRNEVKSSITHESDLILRWEQLCLTLSHPLVRARRTSRNVIRLSSDRELRPTSGLYVLIWIHLMKLITSESPDHEARPKSGLYVLIWIHLMKLIARCALDGLVLAMRAV